METAGCTNQRAVPSGGNDRYRRNILCRGKSPRQNFDGYHSSNCRNYYCGNDTKKMVAISKKNKKKQERNREKDNKETGNTAKEKEK